jgi:hypothetical protein
MLQYTYLAVAALVIVGVGLLGFMIMRRARNAEQEELSRAMADGATVPEPRVDGAPGERVPGAAPVSPPAQSIEPEFFDGLVQPQEAAVGEAMPVLVGDPGDSPEADVLQEIEQLLVQLQSGGQGAEISARAASASRVGQDEPPASSAPVRPEPTSDPLKAVILDMIDGKGRLTGQELKRLDVFRPESIESATDTLELPARSRDDDGVLLRLSQIQLYAATLQIRSKWASQMLRPVRGVLEEMPLSARDLKLKMARDIIALPTSDRHEVTGYLLAGLLNEAASNPELKLALIETLEQLQSAVLATVLLDCLDDPDPIVQEFALAAADRLLDG